MLNLSMVAVPLFLDAALKSTRTSERQILDVEAMSRITSRDDVAFYFICNQRMNQLISVGTNPALAALADSLKPYPLLSPESWNNVKADVNGQYPTPAEYQSSLRRIMDRVDMREIMSRNSPDEEAAGVAADNRILNEVEQALFAPCEEAPGCVKTDILPMIFYIRDNVYGVRYMRANPKYDYTVQLHHAISEVLETLCAHHPFSDVAKLPIFVAFVDLCRNLPGYSLT